MAKRAEQIEELLWDLEDYYPDGESELLEEAWEIYDEEDDLPDSLSKRLRHMLAKATTDDVA